MGIGIQLYTVRDNLAADFAGTLRHIAKSGYEGVEFAGYGGMTAQDLKALVDELNLKVIGAHIGLKNLRENLAGEIEYLKTIGGRYLICPALPMNERTDEASWRNLFKEFEQFGQEAAKHGLVFAYHNHAFEFDLNIDGEFAFDALFSNVSAASLQMEMDAGWIQFAGQDVAAYIAKYANRLPLLHLKDYDGMVDGKINTLELGRGTLDLHETIQCASDAGTEWLIVEQDRCANPPLECVTTSVEWLKLNYLTKF
jgi:sugar phosphate isomerase/epimerase